MSQNIHSDAWQLKQIVTETNAIVNEIKNKIEEDYPMRCLGG